MKTVKKILIDYLKSIGADGLAGDGCGCEIGDLGECMLAPCSG